MRTRARKTTFVLFDELELLDLAAPLQVLSIAGRRWNFRPYKIELVAERAGLITTRNQLQVEATRRFTEAEPAEIVIVPGGYGARRLAQNEGAVRELSRIAKSAELIAGIGSGVVALAAANLIGAERIAASMETRAALESLGLSAACEPNAELLTGERLFTARNTGSALSLGLALIQRTMGPKLSAMVSAELGLPSEPASPALHAGL